MRSNSDERLRVVLHGFGVDSEGILNFLNPFYCLMSLFIELGEHLLCLLTLAREAGVFSLLTLLRFVYDVFEHCSLLH